MSAMLTSAGRWLMTSVVRPATNGRQRCHEALLGDRVEIGGRLVEDEDRRVLDDRPGDREPASLAAAQPVAVGADSGVVAVRQRGHDVVELGHPAGGAPSRRR